MKQFNAFFFVFFLIHQVHAQQATIFGKITDLDGNPLVAASVQAGDKGTSTDGLGNYKLIVEPGFYEIEYSYLGFTSQTRNLTLEDGDSYEINVKLEEGTELLKQATVTSGKFEKPLGEVTVSLEVLKPQLIENSNALQVDEVLEKVPSVTIIDGQPNIRAGSGFSYGAGSRVLLLIDDMPALQGDAGFPNWNFVPVENIAQIEVLKGASSALYGSSAMNGIINIRTAAPTSKPYTKVSVFGTLYGSPRDERMKWWGADTVRSPQRTGFQIAHRQQFGKLDLTLGAYALDDVSFRKEDFERYGRFNVNTRYKLNDNVAFGINANLQRGQSATFFLWQNDTTGALLPLDNTITQNDNYRIIVDPFVTIYRGNSKHNLKGRFYDINNTQSNSLTDQSVESRQYYGEYQFQNNYKPADLVVTTGIVGSTTNVNAQLYGDSLYNTSNIAAYINLDKKFIDRLNLSLGIRYERNTISSPNVDAVEAKPVMRLGANYQAGEFTYIRGSYGQGYRFPTIAEKYINTSLGLIAIIPNPSLVSETGWSAEVGLKQGFKIGTFQGYVDLAAFWMEYNDMMEFTFGTLGFGFASVNIGNTRIRGGEISVAGTGKLFGLPTNILTGYTYSDPKYRDFDNVDTLQNSINENVLKYRFRHVFKFDYEVKIQKVSLGVAFLGYSFMENIDAIFENDAAVPGIRNFRATHNEGTLVTNIRVALQATEKFKLSFLVNNLTNEEYALRPALLDAPRNFSLRMDYRIQ